MSTFRTAREIPAAPSQVFAAFSDPERLARWWGPAGFTNTFRVCDFKAGGAWSFVMHGPDGRDYPNESVFTEIAPTKIVIHHASEPVFDLTVTLDETPDGTRVTWAQAFTDATLATRIEPIVVPANEQNLDRLTAEVLRDDAR